MLVHHKVPPPPSLKFAGTHLYTWVERGTVRVKCLAQEHNTMSPARARTQTTHSRVKHTDHEVNVHPHNRLDVVWLNRVSNQKALSYCMILKTNLKLILFIYLFIYVFIYLFITIYVSTDYLWSQWL